MYWNDLKTKMEARLARSVRNRVELRLDERRAAGERVGSIVVDGSTVFSTTEHEHSLRQYQTAFALTRSASAPLCIRSNLFLVAAEVQLELARRGIYSELGFYRALDTYANALMPELIRSMSVLHRALARLDARVDRRSVAGLQPAADEHRLVKVMHDLRLDAEGLRPADQGELTPLAGPRKCLEALPVPVA